MNICVPSNKYSRCACTVLISVVSACELFIEKTAENMRSVYRCLRGLLHQKIPRKTCIQNTTSVCKFECLVVFHIRASYRLLDQNKLQTGSIFMLIVKTPSS